MNTELRNSWAVQGQVVRPVAEPALVLAESEILSISWRDLSWAKLLGSNKRNCRLLFATCNNVKLNLKMQSAWVDALLFAVPSPWLCQVSTDPA